MHGEVGGLRSCHFGTCAEVAVEDEVFACLGGGLRSVVRVSPWCSGGWWSGAVRPSSGALYRQHCEDLAAPSRACASLPASSCCTLPWG